MFYDSAAMNVVNLTTYLGTPRAPIGTIGELLPGGALVCVHTNALRYLLAVFAEPLRSERALIAEP